MKRSVILKIISLICAAAAVFQLAACSRGGGDTVINFRVTAGMRTADPAVADADSARVAAINCWEGLTRLDGDGNAVPAAAEGWTVSPDGLEYTFTIRESSKWYFTDTSKRQLSDMLPDGLDTAVTAEDFVFALQRAVSPETGCPDASMLGIIVGAADALSGALSPEAIAVRAVGDKVLSITLNKKDDSFPKLLALPMCMPCNRQFFEACDGKYGMGVPYIMSNGPFFITRWNENTSYRMSKSDEYGGVFPAGPQSVWMYVNTNEDEVIEKLGKGNFTAVFTDSARADAMPSAGIKRTDYGSSVLSLRFRADDPKLSDTNLRLAIICDIAPGLFTGDAEPVSIVPGYLLPAGVPTETAVGYNPVYAKTLFDAALADLGLSSLGITITCPPEFSDILRAQIQTWQADLDITIGFTVDERPSDEIAAAAKKGELQAAICEETHTYTGADLFFASFSGGGNDGWGIKDAEYDGIVDRMMSSGSDERPGLYKAAQTRLLDRGYILPIRQQNACFLCRSNINGIYFSSPHMIYFNEAR